MKVRKGFVSNSSSTSYIVEFAGGGKFNLRIPYSIDNDGNVSEFLDHLHDKGIVIDMYEGYYDEDEGKWVSYAETRYAGKYPFGKSRR